MPNTEAIEAGSQAAAIEVDLSQGPVGAVTADWPVDCGAECVFLGRTRAEQHDIHGPLQRIDYEVYESMARQLLQQLGRTATERFACRWVRLVHAMGPISPGEASVVIQVATPHREAAFRACQFLIDQIKAELPVWKREIWQRGETFVDGRTVRVDPVNACRSKS